MNAFVFFLLANCMVYAMWKYHRPLGNLLMHATRACECGRTWWKCTEVWKTK